MAVITSCLQDCFFRSHRSRQRNQQRDVLDDHRHARGLHHQIRQHDRETGETLAAFITKEKMEEAKRLLRYTDKPTTAIGNYLGYSSSGHFGNVFRKTLGLTPSEYREKHGK